MLLGVLHSLVPALGTGPSAPSTSHREPDTSQFFFAARKGDVFSHLGAGACAERGGPWCWHRHELCSFLLADSDCEICGACHGVARSCRAGRAAEKRVMRHAKWLDELAGGAQGHGPSTHSAVLSLFPTPFLRPQPPSFELIRPGVA